MANDQTKTTTLHSFHLESGAHMALFGGYDMPLWYGGGAKGEHLAVIEKAGIFDTSHMSTLAVAGPDARTLLQQCFSKDLESCIGLKKGPLVAGRCVYGLFLNEEGKVIDDALVYMLKDNTYMVVVNAGMGGVITEHMQGNVSESCDVKVMDHTEVVGKMDLQGPLSAKILKKIVKNADDLFGSFPYFSFKGSAACCQGLSSVELLDGTPFMVSRTGYTGEFGFEFFIERSKLVQLWDLVIEAGAEFDLAICGLAARDSLRAGAVLPLSHQDIGDWIFTNTPWPFALSGREGDAFTKDFIGADVVAEECDDDFTYPFAGFDPRKIQGDDAVVENASGESIGEVLTCTTDMAIGRVEGEIFSITSPSDSGVPEGFTPRGLCCGFIKVNTALVPGDKVVLRAGKRKIEVEIRQDIRPHRTARRSISLML